jgi:hypothetical protein
VCFGENASTVSNPGIDIVIVAAQLISPGPTGTPAAAAAPEDKWLWLQLRPDSAVIVARSILKIAKERGWPAADVEIVTTALPDDSAKH